MSSLRNDNLNAFKDYVNGYKNDVSYLCKVLNKGLGSSFYVDDIIEVYKNKIFDYSDELSNKDIDFFSPDCFTRYIIKVYFDILIIHGLADLSLLMNNVSKISFVFKYLPFLKNVTFGRIIERYNKICANIRNFNFCYNKDVLINFFSNRLLFDGFLPGSVINFSENDEEIYSLIKEKRVLIDNIKSLMNIEKDKKSKNDSDITRYKESISELDVLEVNFTQEELDLINEQILNREFEAVQRYHELGENAFSFFETKCSELGLNLQYDQDLFCVCQMKKTLN